MVLKYCARLAAGALALLGMGCTSLREIPRGDFAADPERRNVRMVTRDGLTYEFDFINVQGDSLVGYRRRDVGGPVEDYATVQLPLSEVTTLSTRRVDWYRTGLIGGGVIAALVARGLTSNNNGPAEPGDGGGSGGGRVP